MAIKLTESKGGFINQPGEKVLLVVTKAVHDQEFGKIEITLKNERGETINNNFGYLAQDGSMNEGVLKAFSYFSRVALGDWGRDEVEEEELVGCFVRADIKMVKGTKPNKDGKIIEFANIDKVYMTDDDFEYDTNLTPPHTTDEDEFEDDDFDF